MQKQYIIYAICEPKPSVVCKKIFEDHYSYQSSHFSFIVINKHFSQTSMPPLSRFCTHFAFYYLYLGYLDNILFWYSPKEVAERKGLRSQKIYREKYNSAEWYLRQVQCGESIRIFQISINIKGSLRFSRMSAMLSGHLIFFYESCIPIQSHLATKLCILSFSMSSVLSLMKDFKQFRMGPERTISIRMSDLSFLEEVCFETWIYLPEVDDSFFSSRNFQSGQWFFWGSVPWDHFQEA